MLDAFYSLHTTYKVHNSMSLLNLFVRTFLDSLKLKCTSWGCCKYIRWKNPSSFLQPTLWPLYYFFAISLESPTCKLQSSCACMRIIVYMLDYLPRGSFDQMILKWNSKWKILINHMNGGCNKPLGLVLFQKNVNCSSGGAQIAIQTMTKSKPKGHSDLNQQWMLSMPQNSIV